MKKDQSHLLLFLQLWLFTFVIGKKKPNWDRDSRPSNISDQYHHWTLSTILSVLVNKSLRCCN